MKSFFALLCILLAIFAHVQAATVDECVTDGHIYKVGEKFTKPGKCAEYTCTEQNTITTKGCPQLYSFRACKLIPEDTSKPYPQCCPRFEC